MKKIWITTLSFCMLCFFTACSKEISGTTKIHDLMNEETYVRINLGEAYLQSEVSFDFEKDRAVVPVTAEWGLPKYRDGEMAGISYEEEGAEVYETDIETNPELYASFYLGAIKELNLTVEEVRNSGFDVKVVKKKELARFEEELFLLSGMVVKDAYDLVGVSIRFDDKFRPIKKEFQFEKKDQTRLDDVGTDSEKCTQEFHYDIGKMKFDSAFDKAKKEIDRDM